MEEAHTAGVAFIREQSQCPVVKGDIVVTSNGGYPLDQNLYQSPKAYLSQIPPDKTIPEQWAISTTKAAASFRPTTSG